jgi:3D (Asp-Asp-Asp) domain-containing protein
MGGLSMFLRSKIVRGVGLVLLAVALVVGALLGSGALGGKKPGSQGGSQATTQQDLSSTPSSTDGTAANEHMPTSTAVVTATTHTSPPATATRAPTPAHVATQQVFITFYAAYDNDPAGSREIAYPGGAPRHAQATTDQGTYSHPITLASDQRWLPVGTRVYVVSLHKYYIMEDECVECEDDYGAHGTRHIDLYLSNSTSSRVIAAEEEDTGDDRVTRAIVVNPPANLPVDTTPLYTDAGGSVYATHHYVETLP